ncbi:methyltransferase domain-containing protein [Chroococcidiopsis sp. TS-821]|uniref:methyltransferase domain-containing protein n=1 Tax=Chroococcidiopsis sp. TS-821 TaxID=1378066 RepID=UPI000CEE47E7|nr:methyltransferase domain-containing protein [Chroococcidiopsis sp. TS-821]
MSVSIERLNAIFHQYETAPYPATPIDQPVQPEPSKLYQQAIATPYYLQHHRVVHPQDKVILDVGCGSGLTSLILAIANPGARIIGIDVSPASIAMAQKRVSHLSDVQIEFQVLSAEELPRLGIEFDYINCDEVLYLLPDPIEALRTMKAVLKPDGIIRANLHSVIQRQHFYRAQKMFELMGLFHENAGESEEALVRETMNAMPSWVDLKAKTWTPDADGVVTNQVIRMNYLLQGDKGYTIANLFDMLAAAGLSLIEMVNWQQWDLTPLFGSIEQMPAFIGLSLPMLSYPQQLELFELIHPIHRLLDFWSTHATGDAIALLPLHKNLPAIHSSDRVYLHPQLQTATVRAAIQASARHNRPVAIDQYLSILGAKTTTVDGNMAACLLPLWEAPQSVATLAKRWQQIRPLDPCTLEPVSDEQALREVTDLLATLLTDLYVMVEKP